FHGRWILRSQPREPSSAMTRLAPRATIGASLLFAVAMLVGACVPRASAQLEPDTVKSSRQPAGKSVPVTPPPGVKGAAATPAVPPAASAKKKIPPPQNVSFKTADGVNLSATFYPSPLEKDALKEAVPVILLHSFKGSRADFSDLALVLQDAGCAVLVPDLRGHGQSTRRTLPDGKDKEIEPALMNKQDFEAM